MPTYPYACTECGHAFEVHQSFSDPSLTDCPECSGRLRKVYSSVGVVFKGSGFYRTDSRSGSVPAGAAGSSGSADGGSSGGDTKPAAKPDGAAKTPATTSSSSAPAAAAGS